MLSFRFFVIKQGTTQYIIDTYPAYKNPRTCYSIQLWSHTINHPFLCLPPSPFLASGNDYIFNFYKITHFLDSIINEIKWHLPFCAWLIYLTRCPPVLSMLLQMTRYHPSSWPSNILSCIYHVFSSHSSIHGHLGLFQCSIIKTICIKPTANTECRTVEGFLRSGTRQASPSRAAGPKKRRTFKLKKGELCCHCL